MSTKEVLKMLNERITFNTLEKFNGSSDPLAFAISGVLSKSIQDIIDILDK